MLADTTPTPQPDNTGGSMLALYPPARAAKALAVPGGLPASEIHLTIAYTGDAADVDPEALAAVARNLALRDPLTVIISGTARFTGGDTDVAVALADSPGLEDLRRAALGQLGAHGIPVPREHGYTPHLTRAYVAADDLGPAGRLAAFPVTFTAISAVHGKTRTDYELGGDPAGTPLAAAAREAFAAGYKMTGAPVTPRARAAFEAAVQTACMFEGDPDVIADTVRIGYLEGMQALEEQRHRDLAARNLPVIAEAWTGCAHSAAARRLVSACMLDGCWDTTGINRDLAGGGLAEADGRPALDLRNLQGTWAEVYRRREALTADHLDKVTAVWQRLVKRLKPKQLVRAWRRTTLIDRPVEAEGPDAWRRDEARAAALGWLYAILRDPSYTGLEQAIIAALAAGTAEGRTAALAIAADQAAADGFDWDKAFTAMAALVADLGELPGAADVWVEKILGGAATDVGRVLVSMTAQGASDSAIARAVLAVITGQDVRAVSAVVDYAVGAAMARASLDLYQSEGLTLVSWMTAGDGRVCPSCEDNADNGPYDPNAFPACPDHYGCRCCPAPAAPLPVSAFADFLVPTG